MCSNFDSLWSDVVATIVGGAILTVLFFWFREKIFPLPRITGRWYFELHTADSSYRPYKGMILRYVAMIYREGSSIEGTAEKIYENSFTGIRTFVGKNRTRSEVKGYIEKNYFGKDRLYWHIVEEGHGRKSTHFCELVADSHRTMEGHFKSMVADQDGTVKWQRKEF